jgi:DNA-binding transcriptional LysR family regulator
MARSPLASEARLGTSRLTLRDLNVLISVVQLGSMAKAALHLGMSQPSISQTIADIEHAIGARVLDRGPHGVVPTIYGDVFLKRAFEAIDALRQGMRDIERLAHPGTGDVWVGSSDTWLIGFIPAIIRRLAQRYPDIAIHTLDANASDFDFQKLRERKLDLMIGRIEKSRTADDLIVNVLYEEPFHVVVGARNPWAARDKLSLAELMGERWMFSEATNIVTSLVARAFHANGLELPRARVVTASMCVFLPLLASGEYITVLPSTVLRYCAEQWSLKILPIDLALSSAVGIFILKDRTLNSVVELFLEQAQSEAKWVAKSAKKAAPGEP